MSIQNYIIQQVFNEKVRYIIFQIQYASLIILDSQNEIIQLLKNPSYSEFSNQSFKIQITYIQLRGGGCCGTKKVNSDFVYRYQQIEENFASNLQTFTNIIVEKSQSFQDKMYQDEVLAAFQWFQNHKDQFHIICIEESLNSKYYELIEKITEQLMKQLTIYVKLSGFLFYSLLQICNDLFRIIFSYQLKNEERYMQEDLKQRFLGYISEVESQIQVEAINIWLNGVEFELQMTKTCIAHCRTNSGKGKELAISIMCGLISSISQLKPSDELIDSLIEGGKFLLLNFYDKQIQNPLQIYEIYYFFENLKWSILNQLKLGYSIQNIIKQIQDGYSKYINLSKDWMVHYCWVNLISDLMCYRPIVHRNQLTNLLSQGTSDYEVWNILTNSNQIILLPYNKFAGKLKIFVEQNLILKKFTTLRLFQEYLIQNQMENQLLPNYINFNFNVKKGEQLNNEDIFIQLLTNQSNIELLKVLITQLKSLKEQILSNLESVKQQVSLHNLQQQNNKKIEIKIINQDIIFLMSQIKQSSFLLLCVINEIHLLINKELLMNSIFQTILQGHCSNLGEKQKLLKQQILTAIQEIENKNLTEFLNNLEALPRFWILISQFTAISHEDLIINNLELEESLQAKLIQNITIITNINNYLDKFVVQVSTIKRNFLSILEQKQLKGFMKEPISQRNIALQIIKLLNPNLILYLVNDIHQHFQTMLKEKLQIEKVSDIRTILIMIQSNLNIYKGLQMILKLHHRKLISISTQFQGVFANTGIEIQSQFENQKDIKEYIKSFLMDKKEKLQMLFKKYQKNGEFTKDTLVDFNNISNQIIKEKNEIKNKDWLEQIKVDYILLLSKIQMKLELIGLVQQDKIVIQNEIITLLDDQHQEINQIEKTEENLQLSKDQIQLNQKEELLKLQFKDLFDCEKSFQIIENLINKFKKLKRIFQSHLLDTTSQNQQINLQLLNNLKNTFTESLNQAFIDLLQKSLECYQQINKNEQIILDQEFVIKLQNQPNIEYIPAIIQIFNFNALFFQDQEIKNQDSKVDKIQNMIIKFKKEMQTNQEKGLFDMFQNSSYKVRELLVFNLIKMQSIVQEQTIQEFCENLLKQIWIIEKHPSVRNLLKNEEMIMMQKKLFSKDLQNFSIRLKTEMQTRFKQIQQLETQVLLSDNQDEMKIQLQQAYDNFEIYLDNITDMSQRLDISLIFLREISKDLKNIKSSIDQVLTSVKGIEDDVRRLRGKNFQELLNIRKQRILKQKHENELDQVHIQITTQDYDPISGNKKTNSIGEFITFLIANKYDNFDGEVNEFLWSDYEKKRDIMLIKGKAGSGKSRASRNIEELIWSCDLISPNWIPIYVSLPSLKDPNHNLIDQALESENYNFDKIQVREFKEAVINGNLKIVIILESYDEMKVNCIGTNLYQTNRLAQDLNIQVSGQKVKIIITTREEILNSIGYQTWFYGQNIETLKEVEILPFSREQSSQYIKIYAQISIKRTIKKFYEFLKQLKGQNLSLDEFRLIWNQLESTINSIIQQQQNSEVLFQTQDVDKLIQKLQTVEFFHFINSNQMISLKKELLQLWGEQRFQQVIYNINIFHLMSTPFMMEIIVYILPKMLQFYSQSNLIRDSLQKNFMVLKKQAQKSELMIEQYSEQNINQNQMNLRKNEQQLELQILEQFISIIEDLDNQNFFESFSLANSIEYLNNTTIFSNKNFIVRFDANFIVSAFKLNQFTAFDFYEIFIDFYHKQQLQKLKDLGKSLQQESFLLDLQDFSIYLAIDMSQRQITQVNYKQKGKLFISQVEEERKREVSWEDSYFSENQDDFEYKGLLLKCMLINCKSCIYAFNHKSIQEYYMAKYLLNLIGRIFINEKQTIDETALFKSSFNKDLFNLSLEHYQGTLDLLKPKIQKIEDIKKKLIQLVLLSKTDSNKKYVRSASNSFYILSYLREHFENTDLSNIHLEDTKLNGIGFYKCNLNNSQFNNVSIDSCNFNCATIENVKWTNMICKEKPSLFGHQSKINQIAFSDDGNNLISSSEDGVINLWQVQNKEQPKSINLPNNEKLLTFSKCDTLIACLAQNNIYFFNPNDLSQLRYQSLINYEYKNLFLSPNGKYLATQSVTNQIHFWEMENLLKQQQQQKYLSQGKNQGTINSIDISFKSQLLATGGTQIKIWDATNIKDIQEILEFPKYEKLINGIAFSKDSKVLVTGGENKKLEFWNIENLNHVQLLFSVDQQESIEQISYSNDGKMFASRSNQSLKLYEVEYLLDQQDYFKIDTSFKVDLIEISPNSQILVCCNKKNNQKDNPQIQIWDMKNLRQIRMISILEEQTQDILCLKFRNDNLVLGSCSQDKSICLWDLQKLTLIVKLEAHTNSVFNFGFSMDGTQMVSCSLDQTIIFWNITNLNQQQVQIQQQLPIQANRVIFWPNKQVVVSLQCEKSKEIKFWNSIEFSLISSQEMAEVFLDIYINQDGEIMASLSENRILRIWKINKQSIEIERTINLPYVQYLKNLHYLNSQSIIASNFLAYQFKIQDEQNVSVQHKFCFSNSSCNCMSVAQNQQFIVMECSQGLEIIVINNQISQNMLFLESINQCKDFQFSNDSQFLAVATTDGAFIKNIRTNQIKQNFEQKDGCLSVCFIGQEQLAIGKIKLQFVLYNMKDFESIQKIAEIQIPNNPVKMLFLEQRQQICIYSQNDIILLNLSNLDQIQLIQIDKGNKSKEFIIDSHQQFIGVGFENHICSLSLLDAIKMEKILSQKNEQSSKYLYMNFSQTNSNLFTVVQRNSTYTQFDINSNVILKQVQLKIQDIVFLTFNQLQSQLIAIQEYCQDQKSKQKSLLIDLETNKIISCFEDIDNVTVHKSKQVIFSQDGLYFVSSYSDLVIKLWDAKTCKLLSMFKTNTPSIEFIRISKRGIIAQTSEQVIKLWNLKALIQQQFEMDGHTDSIKSLCITSDGFQLVSGSNTELIRWDLIELKKIDTLLKGEKLPSSFCFSSNCQYFAALDDQQGIHIWKLTTKYIIEHYYIVSCIFNENLHFSIDQTKLICNQSYQKILILNLEQVCKQKNIIIQQNLNFLSRSIILQKNLLIKTNPLELIQTNKSEFKNQEMQGIQINNINAIAICANSNRLAIEDHDYSITIWSIEKKSKESILQNSSQKNTKIWSMVFSGNGKLLFSCHIDEKIRMWDVSDKFVLIQVQDVWPHIDNLYDSRYLLSLQMFPVKDEEYIYIYLQNQEVYNFLSDSIICHFGQTIVLEYLFDDQTKLRNYSVGFSEANNLIAIQFKTKLNLYDISSKQAQLIATLEGNSFEKQSLSSILVFSQKGNNLLSLGRNQTLRLWEISDKTQIKLSINLTKAVQALAFQFLDPETIRIISKSGEIIDQNISDYQEIGIIEDQKNFDFTTAKQSLKEQRYIGKFEKRNLQIFDTQIDELKYTLSDLSSKIMHLQFTPSGEQFILGMEDGSIQLYQIDKQSLQSYGKPVCYYQFAKSTLIQAFYCKISQSVFLTKENENFEKLFSEEIK